MSNQYEDHIEYILNSIDTIERELDVEITTPEDEEVTEKWLESRLKEYDDMRIGPEKARQKIVNKFIRNVGEDPYEVLNSSGSTARSYGEEVREIDSIDSPNQWVGVEGTVISLTKEGLNENIAYKGRLADETGSIYFTVWRNDEGEPAINTELELGEDYRFTPVVTTLFEGANRIEIDIRSETDISVLEGENRYDIDPDEYQETVQGTIVGFKPPMGLVDICTVEGCNKTSSSIEYCERKDCKGEDTETSPQLRTKLICDNGADTWTAILNNDLTEKVVGTDLESAITEANQSNRKRIELYLRMVLHGKEIRMHGTDNGNSFDVDDIEFVEPPTVEDLRELKTKVQEAI